jgi:hypothetical protein
VIRRGKSGKLEARSNVDQVIHPLFMFIEEVFRAESPEDLQLWNTVKLPEEGCVLVLPLEKDVFNKANFRKY